jgi:hypothetical protein
MNQAKLDIIISDDGMAVLAEVHGALLDITAAAYEANRAAQGLYGSLEFFRRLVAPEPWYRRLFRRGRR